MTPVRRKRHCRKQDHDSGWLHPHRAIDPRAPGKGCERPIRPAATFCILTTRLRGLSFGTPSPGSAARCQECAVRPKIINDPRPNRIDLFTQGASDAPNLCSCSQLDECSLHPRSVLRFRQPYIRAEPFECETPAF